MPATRAAYVLFNTAVKTHLAEPAKWHIDPTVHDMLHECHVITGIPFSLLRVAFAERITNLLLRDAHDVCRSYLRDNMSADQYVSPAKSVRIEPQIIEDAVCRTVLAYLSRYNRAEQRTFAEFWRDSDVCLDDYREDLCEEVSRWLGETVTA